MNVFDFAMKMEKDGEAFYRELAEKTSDSGVKTIFNAMADEEVKHYKTFEGMKEGRAELPDTLFLKDMKNVFEKFRDEGGKVDFGEQTVDQYKKAMKLEEESEKFYRESAEQVKGKQQQEVMLRIAAEEHKHFQILENMVELIEHPDRWVEDAEWRHIVEY